MPDLYATTSTFTHGFLTNGVHAVHAVHACRPAASLCAILSLTSGGPSHPRASTAAAAGRFSSSLYWVPTVGRGGGSCTGALAPTAASGEASAGVNEPCASREGRFEAHPLGPAAHSHSLQLAQRIGVRRDQGDLSQSQAKDPASPFSVAGHPLDNRMLLLMCAALAVPCRAGASTCASSGPTTYTADP